jgi:arsenite-transporting ATPase
VGKTTCAAAYAVARAEKGLRVLVVSADPAHSLGDALDLRLGPAPKPVKVRRGALAAAELDAGAALARWLRERRATIRLIAERGTYLDREDIDRFLDLSLPGVDELVALLEVRRMAASGRYDEVVLDTAPTGHLLRLLQMPRTLRSIAGVLDEMQEKHRVVAESLVGGSARDLADALVEELEQDGGALEDMLRDPATARFRWVLLPEALSVAETKDGLAALERHRIPVHELVVNRVTPPPDGPCARCSARRALESAAIRSLRGVAGRVPIRLLPALEEEPRGVEALRPLGARTQARDPGTRLAARAGAVRRRPARAARAKAPFELPAAWSGLRLLLFGGKGGVGKSTCSAAAALALADARPERPVCLLSTDPARRMGDVLRTALDDQPRRVPGGPPNLTAQQIDADAAFERERERYARAVDELFDGLRGGSSLDASYDRAIVRDLIDLAPPGIDEVFATLAVIDALAPRAGGTLRAAGITPAGPPGSESERARALVVVDTAPTGHALRLLEMPATALEWVQALMRVVLKYQRLVGLGALAEDLLVLAKQLRALHATLTDPAASRFVAVTRPEELGLRETLRLLRRLGELSVPTGELLFNALTPSEGCGRCRRQAAVERRQVERLRSECARLRGSACPAIFAPAVAPPPGGAESLRGFARAWWRP